MCDDLSGSIDDRLLGLEGVGNVLGSIEDYVFLSRHTYAIKCNWKIFADNYLDGGYHIEKVCNVTCTFERQFVSPQKLL